MPEDKHDFIIEEETHFRVIKFLPTILKGGINASSNDFWTNLLYSVARKIQSRCGLPPETAYTAKLKSIVFIMIAEWKDSGELISELHANLMRSLLLMLNKCFEDSIDRDISIFGDSKIERIQNYLHTYIYYPEKLKVKQLSISFNMSQSSIRMIFSEQMGMSLRAYIGSLKIQLIKERIINSSDSLSQISREFGFTDSSHLHRFFLSHTGSAPMKFRKKINS